MGFNVLHCENDCEFQSHDGFVAALLGKALCGL